MPKGKQMELGYTSEQEAMRKELRSYYDRLLDADTVAALANGHGVGPAMRGVWKQMCADGWAGIGWPKEFGGQGRSAIEQFIFFDESMRAGAPVPMLTINTVGPTIMNYGTQEQKDFFLPKVLAGDIHFCIGYSEPGAGTDLASLQTRAVRDGDEYVITSHHYKLGQFVTATNTSLMVKRCGCHSRVMPTIAGLQCERAQLKRKHLLARNGKSTKASALSLCQ